MPTTPLMGILTTTICVLLSTATYASPKNKKENRETIKVGLVFDLTGKREPALDVVKGIEVAVAKLQETNDLKIELIKFNSESNAAGTRAAIKELLKDPPDIVIAEVDSSKAVIAAEMLETAKRVMITPFATSPIVTQGRKYVFRACFADDFQGAKLAEFAAKHTHAKRVAIFSDGSELYSQTLANSFRGHFEKSGGQIVHDEKILSSSSSFKEQIDKAITLKADVVFLPVYEQTAARFVNEAIARSESKIVFLGGDGWGASRTFKDIVFRKASPIEAYWVSHYSGNFEDPQIKSVSDFYRKVKGEEFNASSAIGYDTMMVVGAALIGNNGSSGIQDEIAKNIRDMPAYRGVSGTISYAGSQDPQKSLFIRKVDKNKMGYVAEIKP